VTACANTGLPLDMELFDSIEYGVWLDRMNQISNEEIEAMAEAAF